MKRIIISITMFLCLCPISLFGQSAYMRIVSPEYIPLVSETRDGSKMVSSSIDGYREVLQHYNFREFIQAFPTINSKWLQDVYYVEMQSEKDLDSFIESISKDYSSKIPLVEKLEEPVLTGTSYIPDDSLFLAGEQSNLSLVRAPEA